MLKLLKVPLKQWNLTTEITSVLRDIGHLETEVDRLTHDIADTGRFIQALITKIDKYAMYLSY